MDKLISIIVPVYKVEAYLERCVDSILNQTYKNLEIILVDDGSPDLCPAICDRMAKKDERVKVIHKENRGLSDARNIGLAYASGEYIGFVDSDDFIAPDMYETLIKRLISDGTDMACCNYLHVDGEGNTLKYSNKYPLNDEIVDRKGAFNSLILFGGYYAVAWNKLYRRKVFDGIQYPIGKKYEDIFVIHEIIWKCKKISHVSDPLYFYVQRARSIMAEPFSIKSFDFAEAMIKQHVFAKKHKIDSLKHYAAERLSYKFEEFRGYLNIDDEYVKRYKELKKKSSFLLIDKGAWRYANFKGKMISRIRFLIN